MLVFNIIQLIMANHVELFVLRFESPLFWLVSIGLRIQTLDSIWSQIESQKVIFAQAYNLELHRFSNKLQPPTWLCLKSYPPAQSGPLNNLCFFAWVFSFCSHFLNTVETPKSGRSKSRKMPKSGCNVVHISDKNPYAQSGQDCLERY